MPHVKLSVYTSPRSRGVTEITPQPVGYERPSSFSDEITNAEIYSIPLQDNTSVHIWDDLGTFNEYINIKQLLQEVESAAFMQKGFKVGEIGELQKCDYFMRILHYSVPAREGGSDPLTYSQRMTPEHQDFSYATFINSEFVISHVNNKVTYKGLKQLTKGVLAPGCGPDTHAGYCTSGTDRIVVLVFAVPKYETLLSDEVKANLYKTTVVNWLPHQADLDTVGDFYGAILHAGAARPMADKKRPLTKEERNQAQSDTMACLKAVDKSVDWLINNVFQKIKADYITKGWDISELDIPPRYLNNNSEPVYPLTSLTTRQPKVKPEPVSQKALRFNSGKLDLTITPPEFNEWIAELMTNGAIKYARDNWKASIGTDNHDAFCNDTLASALRHINAHRKGEKFDPEFKQEGTPYPNIRHLVSAAWNLLTIAYYDENLGG